MDITDELLNINNMVTEPKNKKTLQYLTRPWVLESVIFFAVLWQESFRLSSRTSHRILPVSSQLQHYYYYNFGDFVNGYIIAFIIDGVFNMLFLKNSSSNSVLRLKITKKGSALFATLFSIVTVVIFELSHSSSTTSDAKDIPAGICGAFLYITIRLLALKLKFSN